MLVSPETVFFAKFIGIIGFLMTVYPPLRVGSLHFKLLKFDKKNLPETALGETLKARVKNFLKQSADEFRPWHFKLMAWGLLLIFLAGLHDFWVASRNI